MVDIEKVKLFIWFCVFCISGDWLNHLSNKSLICLLEECLVLATYFNDIIAVMIVCHKLGDVYRISGEYNKAIECSEKNLRIAEEIGSRTVKGSSYGNLGIDYRSLGEYHKAIEYHEKSLSIFKEISNKVGEGRSYKNLGINYRSLGEYHKANEYHEKSLSIFEEIGDRAGEGSGYLNLGSAYRSLGEYHKAIEYHEKSLSIFKEIGNRAGEGSSYESLGITHESLGEYHKAIEYHEKSLRIAKDIGEIAWEGSTYLNLGIAYRSLGEFQKAIEYSEKCISISKEIGNRVGEESSYGNLGTAYDSIGEFHKAIACHEKSLSIKKEIGDKAGEGSSYGSLGNTYVTLGEIDDKAGEGSTYRNLGNAYVTLGEYQKAFKYYEKSLSIAKDIGDRMCESSAQHNIGVCYTYESNLKNLKKAEEHLQSSIDCYEDMFHELKEKDQFKISFVDTYVLAYKNLCEVQLESKQTEKALLVCDRGRARALRDLLRLTYSTTEKPTSNQKSLELADVMTISSNCEACCIFYDLHPNKLTTRFWVISPLCNSIFVYDEMAELEALEKIVSQLSEDEKENSENGYFKDLVENSFLQMNVREGMKCEDRSLESLQCNDLDSTSRKTATKPIGTSCKVFREFLRCVYMDVEDDKPLEMLFHRLVTPVLDKLTTEEIVIIPDGPLFMVPFAALQDPKTGKYLSETKRIRMAPSLTTLKILQDSSDDRHYKSGALIIGDPAVGKVMYRGIKRDIHPLSGARDEAIEIGKLLGVEPLIGEKAAKQDVLSKLQHGVSVIHFAAHGSARNGEIFLAPSTSSSERSTTPEEKDYMLTMKEAQESGIRAQLVVLSCCHSGRGEIKAEGVVGMSRAFLAAGARAVVASLWAIADQATMVFMIKFYSHLKKGESASRSLQQAMKEMREIEMYKEPMYWAAFFLIGDDVTITM